MSKTQAVGLPARVFRVSQYEVWFHNRFLSDVGLWSLMPLWRLNQVHDTNIVNVTQLGQLPIPIVADGFYWENRWNGGLVIQTADCVPLGIIGSQRGLWLHVGWRGLAQGILAKAARLWRQNPSEPAILVLGPHIQGNSFEIGEDAIASLRDFLGSSIFNKCFKVGREPLKGLFDLSEAIVSWWQEFVDFPQMVIVVRDDTLTHPHYHSWRRDKSRQRMYHVLFHVSFKNYWINHWKRFYDSVSIKGGV